MMGIIASCVSFFFIDAEHANSTADAFTKKGNLYNHKNVV